MDLKAAACLYGIKIVIPRSHNILLNKYCFVKIIIQMNTFVKSLVKKGSDGDKILLTVIEHMCYFSSV